MPKFGSRSLEHLKLCHPRLQSVANEAIKNTDFTIICGHRDKAGQDLAFRQGNTKVRYPNSPHNQIPACAFDFIPYPFTGWNDAAAFEKVARVILASAKKLGIEIRWGADWDRDGKTSDETFLDRPHIELHPWRNFKASV